MSYPYEGEDFCITHGREHMRSQMGNPIPFCELCETDRQNTEREADISTLWQELIDKDDRTSPAEYPEMALITREELADFISRAKSP